MMRCRTASQMDLVLNFQMLWNVREVLLRMATEEKLSIDLKISILSSEARPGKEACDMMIEIRSCVCERWCCVWGIE